VLNGEMGSIFEPLIASGQVDQLADKSQIAGLKASQDVAAKDYLRAMRVRRIIQQEFSKLFGEVDVLLAPGRPGAAPAANADLDAPDRPIPPGTPEGLQGIIPAGNLAGLPALVLPCGFAENLPVALQVVGVPFSENTLLAIGREFQTRTDWHKRHPQVG
jgi:aspartyl-tRNA(Asn)/glutamyl-tRNA(Gln) amidotransferase subunit A